MPRRIGIIIRLTLVVGGLLTVPVVAQQSGQERAANLRAQLVEIQAKQTELQTRLQQLDEDLKPENIERTFAGVGSTHPEELREQRRRQLEIEKKGVQSQLETLAASRTHLESAIATADALTYQSAGAAPAAVQSTVSGPTQTVSGPTQTISAPAVRRKASRHTRRGRKRTGSIRRRQH